MYEAAFAFGLPALPFCFVAFGKSHQPTAEGVLRRSLIWPTWLGGGTDTVNRNMASWLKTRLAWIKQPKKKSTFICGVGPIPPQMDGTSGMLKKTEVRLTDRPGVSHPFPQPTLSAYTTTRLCGFKATLYQLIGPVLMMKEKA